MGQAAQAMGSSPLAGQGGGGVEQLLAKMRSPGGVAPPQMQQNLAQMGSQVQPRMGSDSMIQDYRTPTSMTGQKTPPNFGSVGAMQPGKMPGAMGAPGAGAGGAKGGMKPQMKQQMAALPGGPPPPGGAPGAGAGGAKR